MKKLLFILFLSACFLAVNAQFQPNPYWKTSGNDTVNYANFIGTTICQPLVFKTRGYERMHLAAQGVALGIGHKYPAINASFAS
jgi:hypothetical protein